MIAHNESVSKPALTKSKTQLLTQTAVFAALITIMTAYVCHIPVPATGGYIHFGDSLIYLAAAILPKPYAMIAGAIGGGMADLLTAPMWVFPTIIIKMLITLPFSNKGNKIVNKRIVIACVAAYFISATGYFLAESLLFGFGVAMISSYLGSLVQSGGSAIAFLFFGMALDKMKFTNKFR